MISACNVGTDYAGTGVASYGNLFQWGNNYGFPSTGTVVTSSAQITNASTYGPTNFYNNDVFRIRNADWANPINTNLW